MNKVKLFRILSFILLAAWMLLIFVFSSQNAEESSKTSGSVVSAVIETVYPKYETFTPEQQIGITDRVTLIVRKTAHFSEYFVLGALALAATVTFSKYSAFLRGASAFLLSALYAVFDEVHQYFVPGRACKILDVFIDAAGSLTAVLLLSVIIVKICKKRNKAGDVCA